MRIAILGFWHVHAKDYAVDIRANPESELAAIWDDEPTRGRAAAAEWNAAFQPDLGSVLSDPTIGGVVVTTATVAHGEVIRAALRAGKHVFTEKVLAASLIEAVALRDLANELDLTLGVALSRIGTPPVLAIQALIADGALGQMVGARVRVAHGGAVPSSEQRTGWLPPRFLQPEQSGGGAMIDLGAHPLYLVRLLLGMPETATARYGRVTGMGAEDNAAVILGYGDGAVGVAETSFVNRATPVSIEAHGFDGSAVYDAAEDAVTLWTARQDGSSSWERRRPFPAALPGPFDRWLDAAKAGQ
ncbi:MAG: Gfo/Idh/MocA family protein, partial [Thermomicrobiales bacterium]